jgi:hypothetical protein
VKHDIHEKRNPYQPPSLFVLGSVAALTLEAAPPGKEGVVHDSSQFLANHSGVGN